MTIASWTDEQMDELRRLWAEGLSGAAIGNKLGKTKDAVIGKANRMKLRARPSPIRKRKKPVQPAPERLPRYVPVVEPQREPEPVYELLERIGPLQASGGCRWPLWEGKPTQEFCGQRKQFGSEYCYLHHRKAATRT